MALSRLRSLWRNIRHRDRVERDLDEELNATLQLLIDEKVAAGIDRREARRRAMIELGGIEPVKEHVRDIRTGVLVDALLQDLKYACRHIQRAPAFSAAAILTLAVGIGANTAMFTMLNAIVLKRLPIARPDELIAISPINSRGLPRSMPMSAVGELQDGPLDYLCAYLGAVIFPVLANHTPVQTSTTFVSGQCFNALGVAPILGRAVADADSPIQGPGEHVAVISHRLWSTAYNSDPAILGKPLLVNNVTVSIIGVMPKGFAGLDVDHGVDIFTPWDAVLAAGRGRRQLASYLLGRLKPGVTIEGASAQIEARWPATLEAILPANMAPTERTQLLDSKPQLVTMGTGTSRIRGLYLQPLMLVFALTASLLVLTCVNLGGWILARLNARTSELAVRLVLGGTRWRIAQQMLVESLLLSLSGAALAMPIAYLTAVTLASFLPPVNIPYAISFAPDLRVFAATAIIAVVVGIVMSALPVWFASRRRAASQIRWDRTIVGSISMWGRVLLVAQLALAVVLLIDATLLTRSLYLLGSGDLGLRTENILTVKMWTLPNAPYNRSQRESYYPPLLEKVHALPGVTAVGLAQVSPRVPSGPRLGSPVSWRGEAYGDLTTLSDAVSPGYFSTMGMHIVAGRDVTWQDTLKTGNVAVISESLAHALAPDGNVVGRAIQMRTMPNDHDYVVVGVVSDASMGDPRQAHPRVIYEPILQTPPANSLNPNLVIETTDPQSVASGVRQILQEFGRDYAMEVISLNDLLARAPASERMSTTVAGAVSGIAVLLALIGVHGALAYSVSRRTREIGVRLALGAAPTVAARSVLRESILVCAMGVGIGVPIAALTVRSLRSLMFGISETDPTTFALVAAAIVLMGVVAGIAPARRAASVDPAIALRGE